MADPNIKDFVTVNVTRENAPGLIQSFENIGVVNENTVQTAPSRVLLFTNLADIMTAGFLVTDYFYLAAQVIFAQPPRPDTVASIWKDIDGNEPTYSEALTAAEATNDDDFYFITIDARIDVDILDVATWVSTRKKLFSAQTSDADLLAGTAGNIGEDLRLATRRRTMLSYYSVDTTPMAEGIIAIQAAADLDAPNGQITLNGKVINGVVPDPGPITTTEKTNIRAENANLYQLVAGQGRFSYSSMSDLPNNYMDLMTTEDWTFFRTQEDLLNSLFSGGKVAITEAGITQLQGAVEARMLLGQRNGHFNPDEKIVVKAPKVSDISPSDRAARKLNPPITAAPTIAGAFHEVTANITLGF